ncbi:MAG: formate dehydrogenase subunit delta [Alphaproteobacteria bacterium]|nr:formate dehydrogenase subunit delta [Alphaproteobacteria bacterium]
MSTANTHGSDPEKLVKMANQIGDFFKSYPEATAVEGVREHIAKFWNRKMRDEFFAHLDKGGEKELQPVVAAAVKKLRAH